MPNGGPATADTSDTGHPPANGSAHPNSDCNGETQESKEAPRRDSKHLRPARTSELRDKLKEKKVKLRDRKEQLKRMSKPPGGFDSTPLPDAPQGYTVKFTFHRAYNLPVADLHLRSSDPFIHATLTASVPKRHKEDPSLTRRTRTIRRTTEPVWDEDWVVANVPASGFSLKCRLYDEDWPDHDDRLGNVTIRIPHVDENWDGLGPDGCVYQVKKRSGSKRAYLFHAATAAVCWDHSMTPRLHISIRVLGKSDPPHAQMYTVGPTTWVKHYSPMIGRLAGVRVNRDEEEDAASHDGEVESDQRRTKKYDFQANEIQLSGPVPPELYHRYVEFRPIIGRMFSSSGLRGRILNKVLHKQHSRIYNFDSGTEYGSFPPCSEEASLQFLRMAHFDEGGRIFTYVLTLDGMMRFTETGKEFGIDMLSKHTMHSDVATYIACSGEFFIRRLAHPVDGHESAPSSSKQASALSNNHDSEPSSSNHTSSGPPTSAPTSPDPSPNSPNPTPSTDSPNPSSPDPTSPNPSSPDPTSPTTTPPTHPPHSPPGGPPSSPPPPQPHLYRLTIDNDSGTYRPDQSVLPHLQAFLARNLPGIDVVTMHCADERLAEMKKGQVEVKKREGGGVRMVMRRSLSSSSSSGSGGSFSSDESRLGRMDLEWGDDDREGGGGVEGGGGGGGGERVWRSRRERAFEVLGEPRKWRVLLDKRGGGKK